MKQLTLGNMLDGYDRAGESEAAWNAFYMLYIMGLLDAEEWAEFVSTVGINRGRAL